MGGEFPGFVGGIRGIGVIDSVIIVVLRICYQRG